MVTIKKSESVFCAQFEFRTQTKVNKWTGDYKDFWVLSSKRCSTLSMDREILSTGKLPTLLRHKLQIKMAQFAALDSACTRLSNYTKSIPDFIKPSFYALWKGSLLLKKAAIDAVLWPRSPLLGDMELFWDTPKWEPNKRERVVEWQVIACSTESRCPLFRPFAFHILLSPYFGYVFPRRYKTRQLPVNPEFRTVSFEFDLSLLFLAKTQVSIKRWVWDLFGVEFVLFFIVLGPYRRSWNDRPSSNVHGT